MFSVCDSFPFFLIALDGLKENTLPLSSSVLLMVKRESDADVLHKCLEIKVLTLLTDGESLWVCTQELIKLSVPPLPPCTCNTWENIHWFFLKQCFPYQSIYLPSPHGHGEVIEMCMTGSCEYSSSRKLIWVMTSHKYYSKLKNHHFAVPFLCLFFLYQSHMANLEMIFIFLPGMSGFREKQRRAAEGLAHHCATTQWLWGKSSARKGVVSFA